MALMGAMAMETVMFNPNKVIEDFIDFYIGRDPDKAIQALNALVREAEINAEFTDDTSSVHSELPKGSGWISHSDPEEIDRAKKFRGYCVNSVVDGDKVKSIERIRDVILMAKLNQL